MWRCIKDGTLVLVVVMLAVLLVLDLAKVDDERESILVTRAAAPTCEWERPSAATPPLYVGPDGAHPFGRRPDNS